MEYPIRPPPLCFLLGPPEGIFNPADFFSTVLTDAANVFHSNFFPTFFSASTLLYSIFWMCVQTRQESSLRLGGGVRQFPSIMGVWLPSLKTFHKSLSFPRFCCAIYKNFRPSDSYKLQCQFIVQLEKIWLKAWSERICKQFHVLLLTLPTFCFRKLDREGSLKVCAILIVDSLPFW